MGVLRCSECKNIVSETIDVCPHCGATIDKDLVKYEAYKTAARTKRIIKTALVCVLVLGILIILASRFSKGEKNGSFKYASIKTNGFGADNPVTGSIYIEGKLTDYEQVNYNGEYLIVATIEESKGKEWLFEIGKAPYFDESKLERFLNKRVRCYGHYIECGEQFEQYGLGTKKTPGLRAYTYDDKTIIESRSFINGEKLSTQDLIASRSKVIKWFEKYADDSDALKEDADEHLLDGKFFVIKGLISEDVKEPSDITHSYSISIIQKRNDRYYTEKLYIHANDFSNDDIDKLIKGKAGDGIAIYASMMPINDNYYYMDEYCYDFIDVDFTLEDYESTKANIGSKKYDLSNGESITFDMSTDGGKIILNCSAEVYNPIDATVILTVLYDATKSGMETNMWIDYDEHYFMAVYNGDTKKYDLVAGENLDGSPSMPSPPDWFITDVKNYDGGFGYEEVVLMQEVTDCLKDFTDGILE